MYTRTGMLVLATAAILIVFSGIGLWPSAGDGSGEWWLGPQAAWGQELLSSLEKIEAVVYRQRVGRAYEFGLPEMNVGWERRYNAKDRYRRDRYDDGRAIMNTQWVFRDGNDLRMVEVSYEYECYFERENEAYGFLEDPIEHMRRYVQLLERADRILETGVFDGRECVGFEVSAARYGDNPEGRFDRIWFDVETKLPARVERHRVNSGFNAARTYITIHDQFEYFAKVPAELFVPAIPEGYVSAHPDEIRTARDQEAKGELIYAEVAEGSGERVIAAVKKVNRGSYRQRMAHTDQEGNTRTDSPRRIYFAEGTWRTDLPDKGEAQISHWHVLAGTLPEGPFEPAGNLRVVETMVNYWEKTYRTIDHTGQHPPRHPMERILFTAGLINEADRFHGSLEVDGVECFGFEISAKKYGDNPDGAIHRVWFDAMTALPVRMESHWPQRDGSGTLTTIQDQFEWDPALPEDFFIPDVPPGFSPAPE
jgi:hypothetical protein